MAEQLIDLDGRIVIVTGASGGGIGTALTRMLVRAGATVIAAGRSREKMEKNIAPLVAHGNPIIPVQADVSTDDGIAAVMEAALAAKGTLYGLANVAGGAGAETWMRAERVTRADWRGLFEQNLETMFFMSQAVAKELRSRHLPGSIVGVSSISGMNSAPFHIAYGAAKSAIVAVTRTLATELALDNIRVNTIAPGTTITPGSGAYIDDDIERDRAAIAMGRRADPDEQAGAITFLLSDLSSYITGQTILADGGLNLKWTHLGADNTSLFLKNEDFRMAIQR
ncbi:SDR family NAD(P)-dependent oxidoreductase [Sphingobium boeckii]|uniref:NAD(P)-dependent dehydrogenase (Short-subunit alcohol dehydrogenase family) n=1 Tax=Sphingobium boeckii TaxID=1082345 RepID=A0A7W9AJV3_9SPHN|nr:SDR family oxidoreductase [Sphingobium boeckii]MBB5686786.1 NAD(P)-dependent dehydrogenase (short-subunit alcohol dehydrogenase family) [Sphingobium boeckii]